MNFSEILIQRRKQLGLSQESLAEKIQVSRQAVSKWETGEAMPDMTKLIALADALEMTLDALCGRIFPEQAVNFAPVKPVSKRRTWIPWVLSAALLLCCVVLLLNAAKPSSPASLSLPDGISVSGVRFSQEDGGFLSYRFFPSVAGEDYTYQIVFSGEKLQPQTFGAAHADGMCSGTAYLPHDTYSVSVVISDGETPHLVPVATDLKMHPDGSVGWMPVE